MSIDKLNSISGLIALSRSESGRKAGSTEAYSKSSNSADTPLSKRGDVKELREHLADLVKNISIKDKEAVEALRPQVIRSILLWKYGADLREHPEWNSMLESINELIKSHPASEENFLSLLRELKLNI